MKGITFQKMPVCFFSLALFLLVFSADLSAQDASLSKAKALLSKMTLEEKIGQMTQVDKNYLSSDNDIIKYSLGSLLCGGDSKPAHNIPVEWADMIDGYQKIALKSRLKIPLLYGIDALHGNNRVFSAVIFPYNIGIGASRDPSVALDAGRVTALESAAIGAYWVFSPCVAVARDARWGRTYESYGEDPDLVSEMGAAFLQGLQGKDLSAKDSVLGTPKHFLGDGGTTYGTGVNGGIDEGDTRASEAVLRSVFLKPYIEAVKSGARSIMVSYSSWNGEKMHGNKKLLTDVLKGELGFTGFLISDWAAFNQLPGSYDDKIGNCINAGVDMMMVPDDYVRFTGTLIRLVKEGKVTEERIDDAVLRILRVKYEMGLFEKPFANRKLLGQLGSAKHRQMARRAVRESVVLLKNAEGILPLSKNSRILVVGEKADDIGSQCGGWTLTWQGSAGNITPGTTILSAVKKAAANQKSVVYAKTADTVKEKDLKAADVIIAVIGEKPYSEFKGDREILNIDYDDFLLMNSLSNVNKPIVTILISGRPLLVNQFIQQSKALLAAFLPGTEGGGVADVLFGDYKPTGKLPMSWPADMKDMPVRTGEPDYKPLFPYGFGLSY